MTDPGRLDGGPAGGADGQGAAHPDQPGAGLNGDPAGSGDRAAGFGPAVPAGDLAADSAQAPVGAAVAIAEAPPRAGTATPPQERPAPASLAPVSPAPVAGQELVPGSADRWRPLLRGSAIALLLLAVVLLGFVGYLYWLSHAQEARSQAVLYQQLQVEMANQVAPLGPDGPNGLTGTRGPTPLGSPVAILNIPSIGIHDMVVVQGTTPENLMVGPGHRPDTPMPGQPGVVQIYGRRATFGAPFRRLSDLRPGDTITAVTGQGISTYTVVAGAPSNLTIEDPNPNRMLLLTASSADIPSYYYQIDADLTSSVKPGPGLAPTVYSTELPLANDTSTLAMTMVWSLALLLVAAIGTVAAARWSRWAAYLAMVPLAIAVLWNLYENLAALLPNLY